MARNMEGEEARLAQRSVEVGIKRRKKELNECVAARPDLLEAVIHHYRSLMGGALTPAAATAATTATTTRPGGTPMVTPQNPKKRA
eukprot:1249320-Amphidinium_carterae.1